MNERQKALAAKAEANRPKYYYGTKILLRDSPNGFIYLVSWDLPVVTPDFYKCDSLANDMHRVLINWYDVVAVSVKRTEHTDTDWRNYGGFVIDNAGNGARLITTPTL